MNTLQLGLVLLTYTVFATVGLILMKRGLPTDVSIFPLGLDSLLRFGMRCSNWRLVVGFLCYATSFGLSLVIMASGPLSRAYPLITATAYVGGVAGAVVVLGERMTLPAMLGAALIGAGILIIARAPQ